MPIVENIEHTWEFWTGPLRGEAFHVRPDPAVHDREPYSVGQYDVGAIVRDYQRAWIGVEPNHVTPIGILDLLLYLDAFTAVLEGEDRKRRQPVSGAALPSCAAFDQVHPGYAQTCKDLARWRRRLDEYLSFTAAVPIEEQYDRGAILWEVTAPLFVGWYGGRTSTEVPLDPDAFMPGFDPAIRHPADIATPYSLANQFGIWVAWQDERKKRLVSDTKKSFTPDAFDLGLAVAIGAALFGGYALLRA